VKVLNILVQPTDCRMSSILNGSLRSNCGEGHARPRGMDQNALCEAGRKEDAFLRLRNFGFPDYLRRASIERCSAHDEQPLRPFSILLLSQLIAAARL
jgi:hypothetical protein